jgi:hypothetical protein
MTQLPEVLSSWSMAFPMSLSLINPEDIASISVLKDAGLGVNLRRACRLWCRLDYDQIVCFQ